MRNLLTSLVLFAFLATYAQEKLNYQQPPSEILDLVDVPLAPSVWITENTGYMILRYRDSYKTIEELSEQELRLAGLRINPNTNIGSRTTYYNNIKVKKTGEKEAKQVTGLPDHPRLSNFSWSPDETKIALTHTTPEGVELWLLDIAAAEAKRLTGPGLNANLRDVINWFKDGNSVLVKMLPEDQKELVNTAAMVPSGPTISSNEGKKAQNRTYQDLLKNPTDEFNF